MSPAEILRFALRGLAANKLRSGLTTLGILIGVGAVILLVAVGNGSSQQIQQNIEQLGTNSLTATPTTTGGGLGGGLGGRGFGPPGLAGGEQEEQDSGPRTQAKDLTVEDAEALVDPTAAPSIESASPVVTTSHTATYQGASHSIQQFVGTYPSYFEASNWEVARGSSVTSEDVASGSKVVVIGQTVAEELFGTGGGSEGQGGGDYLVDPVGKQIVVDGVPFTVDGVLTEKGSSGFQDSDDVAIAPLSAVQQSLTGYGGLSQIVIQAKSPDAVGTAAAQATAILEHRHGVTASTSADFDIISSSSLLETASETTRTFTVLLGAVAAISLLVGGIGITNIMLVTVTERTREIGIRKAIGAPKFAILGQFLAEATVLSLAGGLLGVAVGVVGSQLQVAGIDPVVVPSSIALALGVSVAIGLFFGSYPANRAAKLRPIEALRHE